MPGVKMLAARDAWLTELELAGASPNSLRLYRRVTTEAARWCAQHVGRKPAQLELRAVTRDAVLDTLAQYRSRPDGKNGGSVHRSQGSVATFSAALRAFFSWCVETEKLDRSPMATIKAPKVPTRVPRAFALEDCSRLVAAADSSSWPARDGLALRMVLTMGLRLSELTGVTLADFSPSAAAPELLIVRGKGAKERRVPVPDSVRTCLTAYLPQRAARLEALGATADRLLVGSRTHGSKEADMSASGIARLFDRLLVEAGLKSRGIRVHAGRHTFATHALASGAADLRVVQELLGHASVATTQIYTMVDPARMAAGVQGSPLARL